MNKVNWFIRITRLFRLVLWLLRVMQRFSKLSDANLHQREQVLQQSAQEALSVLGITLHSNKLPESHKPNSQAQGLLLAANHISWLDIMAICALYPCGFIAMKEIKNWFIIGKIVQNAGTIFIDRRNRKDIEPINAAIVQRLQQGMNVCFFPEARTTSGSDVLPLKAALFQAAINSQSAIQVLALRYYEHNQRTEEVSFEKVNLWVSLWKIVSLENLTVRIDVADLIYPQPNDDRFTLKEQAEIFLRQIISSDSPNHSLDKQYNKNI
ncbi:MAG: 1-acyl-sn-glycerol-3-phosphate acyltransferase [Alysiella sp.]|uniref:1-acyl-sn-glycerol-3-phosphate acyltransferase n=1 Tax=Alysiella sp. TaxID=1872483 RepID=UPI0026DCECC7|nr:1-acyl-sn-glycerol-3-phosphate acyltransferase [Alysiella sp.]MDO4434327.1 1-acyl-sn-glycerol-3-phosphate acyltransferase [Alysiella sp.]